MRCWLKVFLTACLLNQVILASNSEEILESFSEGRSRVKRQITSTSHRDVLFVIDDSVGETNFGKLKNLAIALAKSFCGAIAIRRDKTRVGVVTFNSKVKHILPFDTPNIVSMLGRLRSSSSKPSSKSCIANALQYSLYNVFASIFGARVGQSRSEGLIILLSPGCENCNSTAMRQVVSKLDQHGIGIISFFAESTKQCSITTTNLLRISSCYHAYSARNWDHMEGAANYIQRSACMHAWIIGPSCSSSYTGSVPTWSQWGKCTRSCGRGTQIRRKAVIGRSRRIIGVRAQTPQSEQRACNVHRCPGSWSPWGECSKSCGGGVQMRSRTLTFVLRIISFLRINDPTEQRRNCSIHVCPVCTRGEWTAWFDRDDPSGAGDYEILFSLRKERKLDVCISPSSVQGRVVGSHKNWRETGELVSISPSSGLKCVNKRQKKNRRCSDYEVRFCCPKIQRRKDIEFVAKTFARTVRSVSSSGGTGSSYRTAMLHAHSEASCIQTSFADSGQKIRMIGKNCSSGRRKKRQAAQTGPTVKKRDILFLIDESGSVDAHNFQKFKRLAQAIVNTFCGDIAIGYKKTRVGVLSFDRIQHPHMNFKEFFKKAEVVNGIGKVKYNATTQRETCLIDSLKYTRESMFTPGRGARMGEPNTEQVLILLSDGCENCRYDASRPTLKALAEKFNQQGVAIITYLVGAHGSSCVEDMASLGDGSHCYQTFRDFNWDEVDVFIDTIETMGCMNSWKWSPSCPP